MVRRILIVSACVVLVALLIKRAWSSKTLPISFAAASTADAEARARIDGILDQQVTFQFQKTPLAQALKQISEQVGVPIELDEIAIYKVAGMTVDPASLDVKGIRLRTALNQLLNPLDLTWAVRDEAILVAPPELVSRELLLEVYPVRDLVTMKTTNGVVFRYHQLIDLITPAVAPTTWDAVGGPGSIQALPATGSLVVLQTSEAHEQIALLLKALRKTRDVQGTLSAKANTSSLSGPPGAQAPGAQTGALDQPSARPAKNVITPGSTAPNITAPK